MTFVRVPTTPRNPIILQVLASLTGGVLLFMAATAALTGGYQVANHGRIFPGVSVAGVDLSGLTPEDASLALSRSLTYPITGQIMFRDGEQVWLARPAELGLVFDPGGSTLQAFRLGRSGGLFGSLSGQVNAWQGGVDLPPVLIFDQRIAHAYLQNLASQIDRPVQEAHLSVNGTQVVAVSGQVGRLLDVDATLVYLTTQLQMFRDGEAPLVIAEQPPLILDVGAQAAQAQGVLDAPLTLALPGAGTGDPGPWTVGVGTLAGLLRIERVDDGGSASYRLGVDVQALTPLMDEIAAAANRQPENARFIFNDESKLLELHRPAVVGRTLDPEASLAAIAEGLLQGAHSVPLVFGLTRPAVEDDATGAALGITELVSSSKQWTFFRGSKPERVQNIQAAADQLTGFLVAPGATFSMSDAMGDISLENGYAEALIIFGGQTIKGIGGGVCQVSTTLFRSAFFAGYPIVERHTHAYRVKYYEQSLTGYDTRLAGLDATVYIPLVDLKFTNDSPYWLLIEAWVYPKDFLLEFKFYSTNDGRSVEWETTGIQNVIPAPPAVFVENSDLQPNEMRQVDWFADGADVTVTRSVWRGGSLIEERDYSAHYQEWEAVCEYGPGVEDPSALAAALRLCQP